MAEPRERRRRRLLGTAALAVACSVLSGCGPAGQGPSGGEGSPRATPSAATGQPAPAPTSNQDPAHYAGQVITYAARAGIDARLLMAILYNESYKPHDPAWQRAWQKIKPDAAFGIANMHKAAFDETKRGRDFAGRDWQELPDDPRLAVEAAAWYLHDLAAQLPSSWPAAYTRDELLALGYDAGPGNMRAFARGARPGATAQSYLDRLHTNWSVAADALRRSR